MPSELIKSLLHRIITADRQGANQIIDQWAQHHGHEKAVLEILEPALVLFGECWAKDDNISLAQGYIAAKIAEDALNRAVLDKKQDNFITDIKGPIVVGNIEDDYHALGRRMVVTFLKTAGWKIYDLGNDVTPTEFVDKAVEVGAKIIGVSAMMEMTAQNIKKLRLEIDRRNLKGKIQLAVGGAIFKLRPELVKEVGGDGTAGNAIMSSKLMAELWDTAELLGEEK